jgi:predicted nucleic acid-binding Zn ribbon protein
MPTYVYRFVDTGETIEVQQAFTDNALTEAAHPETGELRPVRKVFTPVGVRFKGGGFYKTDNRRSGGRPAKAGSDGPSSGSDGGSSSSSDTGSKSESKSPSSSSSSSGSSSASSSSD